MCIEEMAKYLMQSDTNFQLLLTLYNHCCEAAVKAFNNLTVMKKLINLLDT